MPGPTHDISKVFVHIQGIHFLGIKTGEEHVDDQQYVYPVFFIETYLFALLDALANVLEVVFVLLAVFGGKAGIVHRIVIANKCFQLVPGMA
jgi:hypothetical protein